MATKFTEHQQQAIDDGHQNILVSASAGSGKTSVLVERVIQKLMRFENIDELLVATFTEAAAKGMKDRIAKALRKAIDTTEDEKLKAHLTVQISRLAVADISTLHSFCLHLIKQYYYVIDLDPQFRLMADDTEIQLLKENVWDEVREEFYTQKNDVFEKLVQNFSNDRNDDGLTEVIQKVDSFANATPEPDKWLNELVKSYELDATEFVGTTLYREQLRPIFVGIVNQVIADLDDAINFASGDERFEKQLLILQSESIQAKEVLKAIETSPWDTAFNLMAQLEFKRFAGPRNDPEGATAFTPIKVSRNLAKEALMNLKVVYFLQDEETIKNVSRGTEIIIAKLVEVVKAYRVAFAKEKKQRHTLDFNDLEHFAYQILTDQSPEGIAVAEQLRNHYTEVMVDEYQDTNQLQESILQQIVKHNPGNMFMVGDVKQSIYQFRQADPSLFMHKYNAYRQNDNPEGEAIVLAENFRSVKNVTDFTNLIFEQLMDSDVGEMEYDEDAHLKFGATDYDSAKDVDTEVLLYESDSVTDTDDSLDDEGANEKIDKSVGQAVMVGKRIQAMIENGETFLDRKTGEDIKIQYKDIAILVASRGKNAILEEQFGKMGIPVTINGSDNYFQATEVRIVMSLLRVIDNSYQDIPLVAVLRSPMVGLDENELAYLRIQDKTDQYYLALTRFAAKPLESDDQFGLQLQEKINKFLELLEKFRKLAKQNSLVELIWSIYDETGFLDYVGGMPGGKQRQANLHALYNRAAEYENSSFKGIFQFVRFINQMQKKDKDLAEAQTQSDANTVSVTTIHGSKGLEYPVVFIFNATGQFNKADIDRSPLMLDLHQGIGASYLTAERIKVDTLQKQIIKDVKKRKSQAELMRLLYVALTRAEHRLIITGETKDVTTDIASWERAFQSTGIVLPSQPRLTANNFMAWIGMAIIRHPNFDETQLTGDEPWYGLGKNEAKFSFKVLSEADLGIDEKVPEEVDFSLEFDASTIKLSPDEQQKIIETLNYQYQNVAATKTTAYQSVSEIKRLFDDPDSFELLQLDLENVGKADGRYTDVEMSEPEFLRETKAPSASEIGTAMHLVLQMVDLSAEINLETIDRLIRQLVMAKTIPEPVAKRIERDVIVSFFDSKLGQGILRNQDSIKRETPFSLLLPASQLFEELKNSDEEILIHGIIDGYFKTDEGITLFDYKTDIVYDGDLDQILDRYRGQINLYAEALSRIEKTPIAHKYIYLLSVNHVVEI